MINTTDKELSHGQMETNTLENTKMVNGTDEGLTRMQMEQLKKVSGKMESLLNKILGESSTKPQLARYVSEVY